MHNILFVNLCNFFCFLASRLIYYNYHSSTISHFTLHIFLQKRLGQVKDLQCCLYLKCLLSSVFYLYNSSFLVLFYYNCRVDMGITPHTPHRTERAAFPHSALCKANTSSNFNYPYIFTYIFGFSKPNTFKSIRYCFQV